MFVTVDGHTDWNNNVFVIKFFKGVYNLRPPLPRYGRTWDVNMLVNYLQTLDPASSLTLKKLSMKCVALVAIVSGARAQSIHLMNIDLMHMTENRLTFYFDTPLKTSKAGRPAQVIEINRYTANPACCVYAALTEYMNRTRELRKDSNLWISHRKPHEAVGRSSISRWIKDCLGLAGIDISTFSAHSTRMASTSKANNAGVGLQAILKTAGWSSPSNFLKFYMKDTAPDQHRRDFAEAVLATPSTEGLSSSGGASCC